MVLLPLFFNYGFTPATSKQRQTLSLLCELPLSVSTFDQNTTLPIRFYPYFILIFLFLPLFLYQ